MKRAALTGVAVLLSASSVSFAQSSLPAASPNPDAAQNRQMGVNQANKNSADVQQQITDSLKQAGFTNIKVVPDSFVVQATDKSGNAATMFLNPGSMTVVTDVDVNDRDDQSAQSGPRGMFTHVPAKEELSSKVVGLDVYNNANQKIGTIQDIAFDQNGLRAYIAGVGGFIGLGEHNVAFRPSALNVNYNASDKKWHATADINADQIKSAPDAMRMDAKNESGGMFTSVQRSDDMNSSIVGLEVYNNANQDIGKIKDIAFDVNGVKAYIVGVGGLLGLGERYVAVRPSAVALSYNASDRKWHATMDASADQLKSAPQYKYSSNTY